MELNDVNTKVLLNIGYMICNLEREGLIKDSDNGVLTNFILGTINQFVEYDRTHDDVDLYENIEKYYRNKLIALFEGSEKKVKLTGYY